LNFLKKKKTIFYKFSLFYRLIKPINYKGYSFLFQASFFTFFSLVNFFNCIKIYALTNFFYYKFQQYWFAIYFIVNFIRLQEFFSFIFFTFKLFKSFSSGFLLKIFSILKKKNRRLVKKHLPILIFLKKFLLNNLKQGTSIWFYGFKKKYLPLIHILLSWSINQETTWIFKKSFNTYQFRRVKAIKKRIRNSLKKK